MEQEIKSKYLLAKEYQLPNIDEIYAAGLPPTFIIVGSLDLFCMASLKYAQRLICAGVSTEMHVIPGVMHAFEGVVPDSPQAKLYHQLRFAAIKRMFGE